MNNATNTKESNASTVFTYVIGKQNHRDDMMNFYKCEDRRQTLTQFDLPATEKNSHKLTPSKSTHE